jgi:hypothetical protein
MGKINKMRGELKKVMPIKLFGYFTIEIFFT